jgi:hypothetical protein
LKSDGGNAFMKTLSGKTLGSKIPAEVQEKILNHIVFKPLSWDPAHGYEMRRRPKKWKPPPERGRASGVPHRVDELK